MTVRRSVVRVTTNFRRNLERIEAFLLEIQAPSAFDALLSRLSGDVIPALEMFPEIGADFLRRAPLSAEGKALFARVASLLGDGTSLRQLVMGEYILLYVVSRTGVHLLSIRHYRELSFDFTAHWP